MPPSFLIRPAEQGDGAFLGDMVVEAANWHNGRPRPKFEILEDSEHARYVWGWRRPGDEGFLAVSPEGDPVGAAWYRMFPREEPGFGYIGTGVPELIIGVRPIWRAHGVGRTLLQRLCEHAAGRGHGRLSLSVGRGNFAQTLYRSEGFATVRRGIGRDTMVKVLH